MVRERATGLSGCVVLLTACALLLNQVFLANLPISDSDKNSSPEPPSPSQPRVSLPAGLAVPGFGCGGRAALEPEAATTWDDLTNPLAKLSLSTLRVLPVGEEAEQAASRQHWLTFGMSSIKRPKASYLEITLSRLFNVLDLEEAATAIIVHLADFDEEWVLKTAGSLNEGFTNEVEEGDLHVIHAPRELYPLKQANLEAFSLSGFKQKELNVKYTRSVDTSAEQASYVSDGKTYALVWCTQTTRVVHRRWVLVAKKDLEAAQRGDCKAIARAPEELEVLDESVRGWEENLDGKWAPATGAKVSELVFEKGVLLKFGDSAKRTWWRTKQNLDYTFLMWYASNMSDYYMQLEDDVHPVPHFAAFVRSALERTLMGKPWVMAAFSNLGFIGKVFNNSHLPSLAQFLLTYSAEAPCDWLVWVWIDAWSPTPVSLDLAKNLETDATKKADATKKGADAVKKLGKLRDDVALYYFDSSLPRVFSQEEAAPNASKPGIPPNGVRNSRYPQATVESTMKPYQHYKPEAAYPPGDPLGFWTADTCFETTADKQAQCVAGKFFRLKFTEALSANKARIVLHQGRQGHEKDYIRNGKLRVSQKSDCSEPTNLQDLSRAEEAWEGKLEKVLCLDIVLAAAQQEWVSIREVVVLNSDSNPDTTKPQQEAPANSPEKTEVQYELQHALLASFVGFAAGSIAWVLVWTGKCACRATTEGSGVLSCWALNYMIALDILVYCCLKPSQETEDIKEMQDALQHTSRKLAERSESFNPCASGNSHQAETSIDWRSLRSGILSIDSRKLVRLGPGGDPRAEKAPARAFLSIGLILDPISTEPESAVSALTRLVDASAGGAIIGVLVAHVSQLSHASQLSSRRQEMIQKVQHMLEGLSTEKHALVHLLDPALDLYPAHSARSDNIDLALLISFLRPLAETFMSVDWTCPVVQKYPDLIRRYTSNLDSRGVQWMSVHFSKAGHRRKLVRSNLLHRWMEMLLMFPDAPADALYWDFIDVVSNQSVPKSTALGSMKNVRDDVKILYAKDKEAILEHLGDVSSLQGKVQRATEAWFKNHPLLDSLFDNPPGSLRTNMEGRRDLLQSLYDDSEPQQKVTCGGHEAKACRECPKGHGASWCNVDCGWANGGCKGVFKTPDVTSPAVEGSWVELTFQESQDVEAVHVRMGGYVKPPCDKCNKGAEVPDDDFDHALDDAEMLFGHGWGGSADTPSCRRYTRITDLAGREVFWRSKFSEPVRDVRCVRIEVSRAQQHPLVLRSLQVRTTKAKQGKAAAKIARGPLLVPGQRHALRSPSTLPVRSQVDARGKEPHLEWVLLTSLAAFAGAFAGVLGSMLNSSKTKRRRKSIGIG